MPQNARSLSLTDSYRTRLVNLRDNAERRAAETWQRVDLSDFEVTYGDWLGATATTVSRAQVDATRLSFGYLSAFLSLELGHGVRTPVFDATKYAGVSRDGRSLAESFESPRIGVLVSLKDGQDNATTLQVGLNRALRMVEMDTMHAARASLLDGIAQDDRFEGWQRAVRGTCGACAGKARGPEGGLHFQVHPGCQCVSEPVVRGASNKFPRPTGAEIFAAKSRQEQDEMLGPEAAEKVRKGLPLSALVAESHLDSDQPDFITQRPAAAL